VESLRSITHSESFLCLSDVGITVRKVGEKPLENSKKNTMEVTYQLRTGSFGPRQKLTSQLSSHQNRPHHHGRKHILPLERSKARSSHSGPPDVIPQVVRAFRSLLHDLSWGRDWLGRGNPPKPHAPRANNQNIE
jgi:hypothetical protein